MFSDFINLILCRVFRPGIGVQIHRLPYHKVRRDDLRHTLLSEKFNSFFDAVEYLCSKSNTPTRGAIITNYPVV